MTFEEKEVILSSGLEDHRQLRDSFTRDGSSWARENHEVEVRLFNLHRLYVEHARSVCSNLSCINSPDSYCANGHPVCQDHIKECFDCKVAASPERQ